MSAALELKVNGTALPDGVVGFSMNDELLWSEGTGRAAEDGLMVGSVVASKRTFTITWGVISQADYNAILGALPGGFFGFQARTYNNLLANVTAYRGAVSGGEYVGNAGGACYWKGVSVDIVER